MAAERSEIITDIQNQVATLCLNAPQKRNALSKAMIASLHQELDMLGRNENLKAIIIHAEGSVFSAGHDLKEITAARTSTDKGRSFFEELMQDCVALMEAIIQHPLPIIAAVEGMATAAGCQLVASCDLAIAGEKARFCTPGVNIGLFCSTPMVALSRNVSRKHAMEMLLTGNIIDATRAYEMGLVNKVVAESEALKEAFLWGEKIAEKSASILKIGKEAFYQQAEMSVSEAYQHAAHVMVENMLHAHAQEGIGAFIEKRHPEWK